MEWLGRFSSRWKCVNKDAVASVGAANVEAEGENQEAEKVYGLGGYMNMWHYVRLIWIYYVRFDVFIMCEWIVWILQPYELYI